MEYYKNKKGVSLITLIISIIIIIILAGMSIVLNDKNMDEAGVAKFKQEITEVKRAVDTKKLINSKNGLDEEIINKGFDKVLVKNPPPKFVSVDEDKLTAYLVRLNDIDYDALKTGQDYKKVKSGDVVTFEKDDVYVYDKIGTVYYLKGIYIEGSGIVYTADERIANGPLVSAENTEGGKVEIKVTPTNSGEITNVTVGGMNATKISEGIYERYVDKNGSYIVTATEEGSGTSQTTVNVTKLVDETPEIAPGAPIVDFIRINNGENYTKYRTATLYISANADLIYIKRDTTGTFPTSPTINSSGWQNYTTEVTINNLSEGRNDIYVWFRNKGNSTFVSKVVSIILDTTPPTTEKPNVEVYEEHSFRITAKQEDFGSGLRKLEVGYKLVEDAEYTWRDIPDLVSKTIEIENNKPNREYQIKTRAVDNVGNKSESYEQILELNDLPKGVKLEYNPTTGWTKRTTVTITYPTSANDIYQKWYRLAGGEWKVTNNFVEKLYIEENMTIEAVVVKKMDSETLFGNISSVTINNIDNQAPLITDVKFDPINVINNEDYKGSAKLKDNESGLVAYAVTTLLKEPTTWEYLNKTTQNISINYDVMAGTDYYIWVKDAVGNISNQRVIAEKIDAKTRLQATLLQTEFIYSGAENKPAVIVEDIEKGRLTLGTHYDIEYIDNINTGTGKVKITAKRAYEGVIELEFTILKADITPSLSMNGYTYAGTKSTPTVTGNLGDGTVTYYYNTTNSNFGGTAWTSVTSASSLNAGIYYIYATIEETANYNRATTNAVRFTIEKVTISPTVSMAGYTYAGTKSTPTINRNTGNGTVTYYYRTTNGTTNGTPWANVANSSSLNAGTYYMYATVDETTNYKSATAPAVSFTIAKANGRVSLSPASRTITSSSTTSTTSTISSHGGTLSASANSSSVTTAISGSTLTVSRLGNISNNSTVTVTVTSAATTNYKAASATFKITKSVIYDCACDECSNDVSSSGTLCSTCNSWCSTCSSTCTYHCDGHSFSYECACDECSNSVSSSGALCDTCYSWCSTCSNTCNYHCDGHYSGGGGYYPGGGSTDSGTPCSTCGGDGGLPCPQSQGYRYVNPLRSGVCKGCGGTWTEEDYTCNDCGWGFTDTVSCGCSRNITGTTGSHDPNWLNCSACGGDGKI